MNNQTDDDEMVGCAGLVLCLLVWAIPTAFVLGLYVGWNW
jgi:hypothetical protein